jgi:hypothetical protein
VIRFATDRKGNIKPDGIELVIDPAAANPDINNNTPMVLTYGSNPTYYFSAVRVVYGYGLDKDGMLFLAGTNYNAPLYQNPFLLTTRTRYAVYHRNSARVEIAQADELNEYLYTRNPNARVLVGAYAGNPLDVFIFDLQ